MTVQAHRPVSFEHVKTVLAERGIAVDELALETNLEELGFDSLEGAVLVSDLEELLGDELVGQRLEGGDLQQPVLVRDLIALHAVPA